jgi:hypothetical protein
MADYQITCITMSPSGTRHEHIARIGNSAQNWTVTVQQAVTMINGGDTFFTVDPFSGRHVPIKVVRGDPPYVRTFADETPLDNLLRLPTCP